MMAIRSRGMVVTLVSSRNAVTTSSKLANNVRMEILPEAMDVMKNASMKSVVTASSRSMNSVMTET